MIYLKNTGDYVVKLQIKGLLAANTIGTTTTAAGYALSEPIPFASYLKAVWAAESTPGTTGTESVDLVYSATTAATGCASLCSTGTLFSFATTSGTPTYNTTNLTTNPPIFAKGGILGIDVTTIHTSTAGADLIVMATIARERGVVAPAVQTATYSSDLDAIA